MNGRLKTPSAFSKWIVDGEKGDEVEKPRSSLRIGLLHRRYESFLSLRTGCKTCDFRIIMRKPACRLDGMHIPGTVTPYDKTGDS